MAQGPPPPAISALTRVYNEQVSHITKSGTACEPKTVDACDLLKSINMEWGWDFQLKYAGLTWNSSTTCLKDGLAATEALQHRSISSLYWGHMVWRVVEKTNQEELLTGVLEQERLGVNMCTAILPYNYFAVPGLVSRFIASSLYITV